MGFEASGSREVGIGGIGVRRSGLVVRHIDFQIGETSFYEFTNSQSLLPQVQNSVYGIVFGTCKPSGVHNHLTNSLNVYWGLATEP